MIDNFLPKAFASNAAKPDLITIHLGTNDCGQGHPVATMVSDMHALLNHTFAASPLSHVFLADTIANGTPQNTCITAWNVEVPGIVAAWQARGMTLTFVPMSSEVHMCGDTGDDADLCGGHQVHPTSAGYVRFTARSRCGAAARCARARSAPTRGAPARGAGARSS